MTLFKKNADIIALFVAFVFLAAIVLTAPAPKTTSTQTPTNGAHACWVEDKTDGTAERLCGDVRLAPPDAHNFSDNVPNEDDPAFDCRADGNQICGNTEQDTLTYA